MTYPPHLLAAAARLNDVEPAFLQNFLLAVASLTALGLLIGHVVSKIRGRTEPTPVTIDNDPLTMSHPTELATKSEMIAMEKRLETDIADIRSDLHDQRDTARVAIGNIHSRIDTLAENTAEIRGEVRAMSANVQALVDRSMGPRK